jgi:hypothetical protein
VHELSASILYPSSGDAILATPHLCPAVRNFRLEKEFCAQGIPRKIATNSLWSDETERAVRFV